MLVKIVVALLYLAVLVYFAARARRRTRDLEDYYVGGRSVPTVLVAASFYATFVSTNTFVGHSAKSYEYGLSWLIVGVVLAVLAVFSWIVVAPRFRVVAGRLGSVVPSDLFRLHYGSRLAGGVAGAIILFDSLFFLAAVLLGASGAMAALLGIRFTVALGVVFLVQLAYTAVGGYLADVWSDAVQAVILFVGAVALPMAMVLGAGGWNEAWASLSAIDAVRVGSGEAGFSLLRITTAAPLVFITGIGLSGGLKLVADPRQLSRFYGLANDGKNLVGTAVWLGVVVGATYLFLLPIGLLSRVYGVPEQVAARSDAIVPWLLGDAQLLGPIGGAVVLTALLAAAMSTIDSVLLVAAASVQRDVLPLLGRGSGRNAVARARWIVFVLAVSSLVLALVARSQPGWGIGIVELTVFAGALYAGAFLPGLFGILYWRRAGAGGAVAGMIAGVVSTAVWRFAIVPATPAVSAVPEVFVGVVFGTGAFVLGSLTSRKRSQDAV